MKPIRTIAAVIVLLLLFGSASSMAGPGSRWSRKRPPTLPVQAAQAAQAAVQKDKEVNPKAVEARSKMKQLKKRSGTFADDNVIMTEILNLGPDAVDGLVEFIREPAPTGDSYEKRVDWGAKVGAMNLLAEFKNEKAVPALKEMLETSEEGSAIVNSARTMGRIGGKKAYQALSGVLENARNNRYQNSETHRKAAVIGLGLCGDQRALPLLKEEMEDLRNPMKTRVYAAGCMGLHGASDGLALAHAALASDDYYIQMAGLRAAGAIGSESSLALVQPYMGAKNAMLRETATKAMGQIVVANTPDSEKVQVLMNGLYRFHGNMAIVQWGTGYLKKLNTPEARQALEELDALKEPAFARLRQVAAIRLASFSYQ